MFRFVLVINVPTLWTQNESWLVLGYPVRPILPGYVKNPTWLIEKCPVVPIISSFREAVDPELDRSDALELYSWFCLGTRLGSSGAYTSFVFYLFSSSTRFEVPRASLCWGCSSLGLADPILLILIVSLGYL